MYENLFELTYLPWAVIIVLIPIWIFEVWKHWRNARKALSCFRKTVNAGFSQS